MRVPKARSRSGSLEPFRSSVAPPYVRRCASLDAAIPWLYLHGVSAGQMRQAVAALVGERAARGLSANVVSRLKRSWDQEYRQWRRRRLDDEWVYLWADGLYSGLRGEGERLCVLVVIGVNTRGEKHFLAIEDGVRESMARGAAGDEAARLHPPGQARRGQRSDGVPGGAVGGVSIHPPPALLGAQDRERPELPPQVQTSQGQAGPARDPNGRDPGEGRARLRPVARALPRQVPQGHRLPGSRSTTSPPRTGRTFEPPTSSNRPLPRSAIEAHEPRAASPERPCSRWSTRWAGARRNPGAGCGASDTSPRSSRESGSTTASRTAEPPHEQPPVHQI